MHRGEAWSVKEDDVIKLKRNDIRMVRWMCNVSPKNGISVEELRTGLKFNSMMEDLQDLVV